MVTGNFSIQNLYIDRSMFHLNWPVMDSDLWSLHAVFVSLFLYLLICLFCFNYIGFIETLSDSDFGQEFYFLSRWSLGVLSSISCLSAILETRCCPWQQADSFPVGQTSFCEFLSIFNISAILDSVVAHSNKNSISCGLWASSVWSNIGLYSLYILYTLQLLPLATSTLMHP